jgi:uroporphyrinogen decarboxylase
VPVIQFSTGTAGIVLGAPETLREAPATVIGVDWRVDLNLAWERLGYDVAIQGNLDPVVLFADHDEIVRQAGAILQQAAGRPGHIFNVGHGILPETPLDNVAALVDMVHGWRQ